ncbi:MAG: hypothetical protein MK209_01485 [Planctomycetes bacterium]|nr:hypothetical protein [Planctomycetota bacterium]
MTDRGDRKPDLRRVVMELLLDSRDYPTRRFGAAVRAAELGPLDRSLARQLLGGVLRRAVQLDAIYEPYCKKRVTDDAARWALRLGTLQLFFLSQVPEHAAVHATIQAARPFLRERTGFAHAVLRSLQRKSKQETPFSTEFSRRRLTVGRRSWWFDRSLFADPKKFPIDYHSQQQSFPVGLVRRWFDELGEDAALMRMQALGEAPPVWLRVHTARVTRSEALAALREANVEVEEADHPRFLLMRRAGIELAALPGYAEGHWAVQDITSFEAVEMAQPKAGERVLDLCAAPGGKSFAVAELTEGKADILACDIDSGRLARLSPEADRLGHTISVEVGEPYQCPARPVDLLILDVPCTNTGVLHKRPEARARFHKDELHRATTVQNLIRKAVQKAYLSPEGQRPRVLWTTCSLEPEENEEMAARIAKHAQYRIVEERRFEPDGLRAGGYAAILGPEPVE